MPSTSRAFWFPVFAVTVILFVRASSYYIASWNRTKLLMYEWWLNSALWMWLNFIIYLIIFLWNIFHIGLRFYSDLCNLFRWSSSSCTCRLSRIRRRNFPFSWCRTQSNTVGYLPVRALILFVLKLKITAYMTLLIIVLIKVNLMQSLLSIHTN